MAPTHPGGPALPLQAALSQGAQALLPAFEGNTGFQAPAAPTCQHHQRLEVHCPALPQAALHQAAHLHGILPRPPCMAAHRAGRRLCSVPWRGRGQEDARRPAPLHQLTAAPPRQSYRALQPCAHICGPRVHADAAPSLLSPPPHPTPPTPTPAPGSNAGEAMGENSTLKRRLPSLWRSA